MYRDVYLWPVVEAASEEELAFVRRLLGVHDTRPTPSLHSPKSADPRQLLHDAVLRSGGHLVANCLRDHGPGWKSIVEATAKRLEVPAEDLDTPALEQRIATRLLVDELRAVPVGERPELPSLPSDAAAALWALVDDPEAPSEDDFEVLWAYLEARGVLEDASAHDATIEALYHDQRLREAGKALLWFAVRVGVGGVRGAAVSIATTVFALGGPRYGPQFGAVVWTALVRRRTGT